MNEYYQTKQIYLDDDLVKQFDRFLDPLRKDFIDFQVHVINDLAGTSDKIQVWQRSWETSSQLIPELRKKLVLEFRAILGAD